MANLTDNGSTGWFDLQPYGEAIAEGNGTWGSGSLALEVQSVTDGSTAVAVTQIDGTAVAFTADFAVAVRNHSGQPRKYRLTLSGATSPNLNVTIE